MAISRNIYLPVFSEKGCHGGGRVEGQEVAHFQYYHVPMWRLYLLPLPPPCYTLSGCGLEDAGGGGGWKNLSGTLQK